MELVHVGILSEDDIQQVIAIKFNPVSSELVALCQSARY